MKKVFFYTVVILAIAIALTGCLPKTADQVVEAEAGYYFYLANSELNVKGIYEKEFKFNKVNDHYELTVPSELLFDALPLPKNDDNVWWWKVIEVKNSGETLVYGGDGEFDPSVPLYPEHIRNKESITFYFDPEADTSSDHKIIEGVMGDNSKDHLPIYFVGNPTGWNFEEMTDGKYVVESTNNAMSIYGSKKPMEFKIAIGFNGWDKMINPLLFSNGNYYGTGPNTVFFLDSKNYVDGVEIIFDPHFSKLEVRPTITIDTIDQVIEKIDENATNVNTVGSVNYAGDTGIIIQDSYNGIFINTQEELEVGDLVYVQGSGRKENDGNYIIDVDNLNKLDSNKTYNVEQIDKEGIVSSLYGKLVLFEGFYSQENNAFDLAITTSISEEIKFINESDVSNLQNGQKYIIKGLVIYQGDELIVLATEISQGEIIIDGEFSEWEIYDGAKTIVDDSDNDSEWGETNDVNWLGIAADEQYLYIGAQYKASNNGFIVYISIDGDNTGATDMNFGAWPRAIKFDRNVQYFVASWEHGNPGLWQVVDTETKTDKSSLISDKNVKEGIGYELKVPLSELGLETGDTIHFVGCIVGGDGASSPDTAPDNDYPDGWDWNVDLNITNMAELKIL